MKFLKNKCYFNDFNPSLTPILFYGSISNNFFNKSLSISDMFDGISNIPNFIFYKMRNSFCAWKGVFPEYILKNIIPKAQISTDWFIIILLELSNIHSGGIYL